MTFNKIHPSFIEAYKKTRKKNNVKSYIIRESMTHNLLGNKLPWLPFTEITPEKSPDKKLSVKGNMCGICVYHISQSL